MRNGYLKMLTRIEIDTQTQDVTYFFDEEDEPYSALEFRGKTESRLLDIEDAIYNFNHMSEPGGC
jgi:hypothetical protein